MIGVHHVEVSNRDAKFKFDLYRNLTIVRGKSGTGKTTLYEMIADYTRLKDASGVNISCDKTCISLVDLDWKNQLMHTQDSIVFIDEGAAYIRSQEFARIIAQTDNYYVIFSRESLHELPYSVEEIYEIKSSGKYHSFKKIYKSDKKHVYYLDKKKGKLKSELLLTEDSNSGFQFFEKYAMSIGIACVSAGSNSSIFGFLKENRGKKIFVIADGAAFGSEIDRVLKLQTSSEFQLCLPESFEWLILKSGLIKSGNITSMLENPSAFIESAQFFSWENFFYEYLKEQTENTPFQYMKRTLNPNYLNPANLEKIVKEIS